MRRDFKSLEITLPDRELELKLIDTQYGTSPSWRGATAEIVNEFLARHVPAQRIEADVVGERPARRIDVEKQLTRARENRRDLRRCLSIFGLFFVACLVWMAIADSVFKAAFMAGLCSISYLPICWSFLRLLHARCLDLSSS